MSWDPTVDRVEWVPGQQPLPGVPSRFVLAPVVDGAAAWEQGAPLVLAPIRLSSPVTVALAYRQRSATGGVR